MSTTQMPKITPEDTDITFLGSGALSYPWYQEIAEAKTPDGEWTLTFTEYDGDAGKLTDTHTLRHADLMKVINKVAREARPYRAMGDLSGECRIFLFKGPDEADFDADMADQIIQAAAFGEVSYS